MFTVIWYICVKNNETRITVARKKYHGIKDIVCSMTVSGTSYIDSRTADVHGIIRVGRLNIQFEDIMDER